MCIRDRPHSGRPSTSRIDKNVEKVHPIVLENRRQPIEEISKLSGIDVYKRQVIM